MPSTTSSQLGFRLGSLVVVETGEDVDVVVVVIGTVVGGSVVGGSVVGGSVVGGSVTRSVVVVVGSGLLVRSTKGGQSYQ